MQESNGRMSSYPLMGRGGDAFETHRHLMSSSSSSFDSGSCSTQTNHHRQTNEKGSTYNPGFRRIPGGCFDGLNEFPTAEWKSSTSNPSQYAMHSSQFPGVGKVTRNGYNDPEYNSVYSAYQQSLEGVDVRSNCSNVVSSYPSNMAAYDATYPSPLSIFPFPVGATYRRVSQNPSLPKAPLKYDLRIPLPTSQRTDLKKTNGCSVMSRKNSSKRVSKGKLHHHQKAMSRLVKPMTSHPFNGVESEFVFVWDLDETIVIFNSLLDGSFAHRFGTDLSYGLSLALKLEELIFFLAETHFFLRDLNGFDQVHIDDASSADNGEDLSEYNFFLDGFSSSASSSYVSSGARLPSSNPLPSSHPPPPPPPTSSSPTNSKVSTGTSDWMRKLAFRYRKIKDAYNIHCHDVGVLLGPLREQEWHQLRTNIERLTGGWLSVAFRSLTVINSRSNCINVLVTTTHLVPTLSKVLLFGLGEIFQVSNVYSAAKVGKVQCFEQITARFGRKSTYLVIGDGYEEEMGAKQRCWPFWRISNLSDLYALQQALDLGYL